MLRPALVSAALLISAAAAAESQPCNNAPNQTEATICTTGELAKADAALNQTYGELRTKLDALGRHNLAGAEKAWITFRDAECNLRSGYDAEHLENHGTIAPMILGQCRITLTRQRTAELREQIKCPGGDLSCTP